MRTEDLIADLASRATPVRPLPSPGIRVLAWSAVAMICAVVGTIVFGTRADLGAQMREPAFVLVGLVAFATSALAALASLVLAIPGAERSPALRSSTVAVVVLWAVILVAAIVRAGHGFAGAADWPICFVRVVAIALVPAGVLFGMLRRSAPLRLGWTSALAAAAAIAAAAIAIQFICPLNDPAHALLGHLGPVLALGALAAWGSQRLFARNGNRR